MSTNISKEAEPLRTPEVDFFQELNQEAKNLSISSDKDYGCFMIETANETISKAKARPKPEELFKQFWYQNELCILFADTNLGKSVLAVQIGIDLSKRFTVLYMDFELSDKQFELRYEIAEGEHYQFSDSFLRAEIDPTKADYKEQGYESFEQFLYQSLEQSVLKTNASILIIDNITYLKDETEKARFALPLMKHLQALKKKHGLSILALAHTPKRDLSKPLTRNDLQGSKMLINFTDSSFAIGESTRDKNLRYLKQIKARNTQIIYDSDYVIECEITKGNSYLRFEELGFGQEADHLRSLTETDKEDRLQKALELKEKGWSNVRIAQEFRVSEGAVRKWFKRAEDEG